MLIKPIKCPKCSGNMWPKSRIVNGDELATWFGLIDLVCENEICGHVVMDAYELEKEYRRPKSKRCKGPKPKKYVIPYRKMKPIE